MGDPKEKDNITPVPTPTEEEVFREDTDLYGDESDAPRRKKKKKKASAKKKTASKKTVSLLSSDKPKKKRKRRSYLKPFGITYDEKNYKITSVRMFGRDIRPRALVIAVVILVLFFSMFAYNSGVSLDKQKITIVGLPRDLQDYSILVISDLNGRRFGDEQTSLLRTLNKASYKAVFFLGDMVASTGDPQPFYELIDAIPSSKPIYFICGDNDPGPYVDVPRTDTDVLSYMVLEDWILGAIERGATYVDSPVQMKVGDTNIWITPSNLLNYEASSLMDLWEDQTEQEEDGVVSGLASDYNSLPITTYRYRLAKRFRTAVLSMSEDDFSLVLSHQPLSEAFILASASHVVKNGNYVNKPELILSGHYCGGTWQLPFLGALYIPDTSLPRNGW
ncbi:MAG: hypothetical protein MJ099_03875, partial [Clostridia bacterium]|nr:hypothetical protein [Clostridia bacterium]